MGFASLTLLLYWSLYQERVGGEQWNGMGWGVGGENVGSVFLTKEPTDGLEPKWLRKGYGWEKQGGVGQGAMKQNSVDGVGL